MQRLFKSLQTPVKTLTIQIFWELQRALSLFIPSAILEVLHANRFSALSVTFNQLLASLREALIGDPRMYHFALAHGSHPIFLPELLFWHPSGAGAAPASQSSYLAAA